MLQIFKYICRWVALSIVFSSTLLAIDPSAIKGTYICVADQYKRCSPINGAIWWESGLIRKYYDFGFIKEDKQWPGQGDGVIRLVHALFHVVGGSFGASDNVSYPAKHISAKTIGVVIGQIEKDMLDDKPVTEAAIFEIFKNDLDIRASIAKTDAAAKKPREELQAINKEIAALNVLQKQHQEQVNTDEFKKKLNTLTAQQMAKNKELARLDTKRLFGKKSGEQRFKELAKAIADACAESGCKPGAVVEDIRYPQYATHSILLAFMYRKAASKQDFYDYLTVLNEFTSGILTSEGLTVIKDAAWVTDVFNKQQIPTFEQQFKDAKTKGEDFGTIVLKQYEELVYTAIITLYYASDLPKIAEYATVLFKKHFFANCMETTIRNLCNIILYNQKAGIFDIANYTGLDPIFEQFYVDTVNQRADQVESQLVHQNWTPAIENRPLVVYNQLIDQEGKSALLLAPEDTQGFLQDSWQQLPAECIAGERVINGLKFKTITYNERVYIVYDPAQYAGFEVQPSLRNTIVLLNTFFGLQTIDELASIYWTPDFNEKQFPVLCTKLGLSCDIKSLDVDKHDYKDKLHIELKKSGSPFSIILSTGHGYIKKVTEMQAFDLFSSKNITDALNKTKNNIEHYALQQLLPIFSPDINYIMRQTSAQQLQMLFYVSLYDNDLRVALITAYMNEQQLAKLNAQEQKTLQYFLEKMITTLPVQADLLYHKKIMQYALETELYQHNVVRPLFYQTIETALAGQITDNKIKFFELLCAKGRTLNTSILKKVINTIEEALQSPNTNEQNAASKLFRILLQYQFASDEQELRKIIINKDVLQDMLNAAQKAIQSSDDKKQLFGVDLFNVLLKCQFIPDENEIRKIIINSAKTFAQQAMQSSNINTQKIGLALCTSLLKCQFTLNEQELRKLIINKDVLQDIINVGINTLQSFNDVLILEVLIEYEFAPDEENLKKLIINQDVLQKIMNWIKKTMQETDKDLLGNGLSILKSLVVYNFKPAEKELRNLIINQNVLRDIVNMIPKTIQFAKAYRYKRAALDLFIELLKYKFSPNEQELRKIIFNKDFFKNTINVAQQQIIDAMGQIIILPFFDALLQYNFSSDEQELRKIIINQDILDKIIQANYFDPEIIHMRDELVASFKKELEQMAEVQHAEGADK